MDKFLNVIGFEEVEESEGRSSAEEKVTNLMDDPQRKKRGSLVSLPGPRAMRVVVCEPKSFEEVQPIADHLKAKRPVILNLEEMDKDLAQRFLNFLSGTIYALDGTMQRIGTGIFLFTPSNVEVTLREREELKEHGMSMWNR